MTGFSGDSGSVGACMQKSGVKFELDDGTVIPITSEFLEGLQQLHDKVVKETDVVIQAGQVSYEDMNKPMDI